MLARGAPCSYASERMLCRHHLQHYIHCRLKYRLDVSTYRLRMRVARKRLAWAQGTMPCSTPLAAMRTGVSCISAKATATCTPTQKISLHPCGMMVMSVGDRLG